MEIKDPFMSSSASPPSSTNEQKDNGWKPKTLRRNMKRRPFAWKLGAIASCSRRGAAGGGGGAAAVAGSP